jgi:arylsulfatase A-like enzyme
MIHNLNPGLEFKWSRIMSISQRVTNVKALSITLVGFLICVTSSHSDIRLGQSPPNVVLITIDNHHTSVLGFAGNRLLETPHIDRLYHEGVFFSNYHTASRCSASRAAMMTGRYHLRSGAIGTGDARSTMGSLGIPTIADLFHDAGYQTAMFGKWHLGANYPFLPEDRGFDEVVSYGPDSSTIPLAIGGGGKAAVQHKFRHNGQWKVFDGFRTDVWFRELSRFIRKNHKTPFFAYLATWSTHGPNKGPVGLSDKYKNKLHELKDFNTDDFLADEKKRAFLELAAEMDVIDRNIGSLLDLLKELGIRENTIIVYTSDGSGSSSPSELVGQKHKELQSFCPAIINWPARIKGGREVNELVANIDMAPTLLEMCGISPSRTVDFDGQSFYGLISTKGTPWKERVYIADHQSKAGDRRVILRPFDDTTVYMPQGSVHFRDGRALKASAELEAPARKLWKTWWEDVTSDFQPYQYVIVGTRHKNPMFVKQAYTESASDEKVRRYVIPVEFAIDGTYVFSKLYDDPASTAPSKHKTTSSEGYLIIDNNRYEGTFPMKRRIKAGRYLVRISLDGRQTDKAVRIEHVSD